MKLVVGGESSAGRSWEVRALSGHLVLSGSGGSTRCDTAMELVDALRASVPAHGGYRPRLDGPAAPASRADAALLVAVSELWPSVLVSPDQTPYHATLAYAFPLALDPAWRDWTDRHADLLIGGRQLVLVPASDLVAVEPAGDPERRHRRLLRRHEQTSVREHSNLPDFLADWADFVLWRYGTLPSASERDALRTVLEMAGCTVRDFVRSGEVIARTVTCAHVQSRTLFDLLAVWDPRHAVLRPGILSAVHNLIDAASRGYRFSMCYGRFPYKDHVVAGCRPLTLDELSGRG
jgi:hypothetical protein